MLFQKQLKNIISTLLLLNLINAQNVEKKEQLILTPGPIKSKYNKNDLNEIYDESSIEIHCQSTACTSSNDDVLLEEGKVTISNAGTYIFDGELNGQLNIAATKDDLIHLILRNVTISSDFGPAVYAECKKLVITTEGHNTISDSTNYPKDATTTAEEETEVVEGNEEDENKEEEEVKSKSPDACIYADSNLTINGKGTLDVNGNFKEGIRSKKNIKLVSGDINVVSKGNAIKAKESISIKDPVINIETGASGIKVTKTTDPNEGFVVIEGGKTVIKAVKDGIHAETHLTVSDGYIEIIEGEEGLEGQMIDITGGNIIVNVNNDGINAALIGSNGEDIINESQSQDQDQKPSQTETYSETETLLPIDDEKNEIENVNEEITIEAEEDSENDETIIEAEEDSENDEGKNNLEITIEVETEVTTENESKAEKEDPTTNDIDNSENPDIDTRFDEQVYIRITGGKVQVTVEGNVVDGIDSNGSLYIGGNAEVYVSSLYGGIFGHLAAIDSIGTKLIGEGATAFLTASGKFTGMPGMPGTEEDSIPDTVEDVLKLYPDYTIEEAEELLVKILELEKTKSEDNFVYDEPNAGKCLQPFIRVSFKIQERGTLLKILDSKNNTLIEHSPTSHYAIILYTSPEIIVGETYTVVTGDVTETVVAQVDKQ